MRSMKLELNQRNSFRRAHHRQGATMVRDGGRRPKISVDVLRADLAEARLEARELGEENTQLRDEL